LPVFGIAHSGPLDSSWPLSWAAAWACLLPRTR
jgi:hypothetical protein